jgi:type III pantothenate kinase
MLLAIDVGNTNIVFGLFDGRALKQTWRVQTLRDRTSDELGLFVHGLFGHAGIAREQVHGVVLGSVVPPLTGTVVRMVRRYLERDTLVVDPAVNAGMPILYEKPADVGADRIVAAIAAQNEYGGSGQPMIVCDFGTATTLDAVSAKGEYLGGVICPGVNLSAEALFQRAARLPRVEVRKPETVVGRTTVGAMESGLFYGYVGMVEGLVRRIRDELGGRAVCVATGGLAPVIAPETTLIQYVDDDLILKGLLLVWQRNQSA